MWLRVGLLVLASLAGSEGLVRMVASSPMLPALALEIVFGRVARTVGVARRRAAGALREARRLVAPHRHRARQPRRSRRRLCR